MQALLGIAGAGAVGALARYGMDTAVAHAHRRCVSAARLRS
jgi:hypothetical protein